MASTETLPDFTVGILLYPNCDLLDVAGPNDAFEFFDATPIGRTSRVVTLARHTRPMGGIGALKVSAGFDYESCPPLDLLFVPGGGSRLLSGTRTAGYGCAPSSMRFTLSSTVFSIPPTRREAATTSATSMRPSLSSNGKRRQGGVVIAAAICASRGSMRC